jgi:MFS family permease
LLIFFIRLFVPESAKWERERDSGRTSHWSNGDLLGVVAGCAAAIGIITVWSPAAKSVPFGVAVLVTLVGLAVSLLSFLFPVRQFLSRAVQAGTIPAGQRSSVLGRMLLGSGLAGVALLGTWGSIQWAPRWASEDLKPDTATQRFYAKEKTQAATATGAIISTILAAVAAGRFGRRVTYSAMCVGSFAAALYFFLGQKEFGPGFLAAAVLAGGVTASFYGFFPLYFPELFPTSVRATGQGFSFNFGRIIAAIGGLQTAPLMAAFGDSFAKAGSVMAGIYLVGAAIIWFGPETKGQPLPE